VIRRCQRKSFKTLTLSDIYTWHTFSGINVNFVNTFSNNTDRLILIIVHYYCCFINKSKKTSRQMQNSIIIIAELYLIIAECKNRVAFCPTLGAFYPGGGDIISMRHYVRS